MFKKKDLDTLLGIGRVRASIAASEEAKEIISERIMPNESAEVSEAIKEEIKEPVIEPIQKDNLEPIIDWSNDKLISAYENQIAFLQQQLAVKDDQLSAKDDIIKNFQVLLKREQDTVIQLTYQVDEQKKEKGWRRWFMGKEKKPETAE